MEAGKVKTHAYAMFAAEDQRTPLALREAPTPSTDEPTTCVALTGPPNREAPRIIVADDN